MCESVLRVGQLLKPIAQAIKEDVLSSELVQTDGTEVLQRFARKKGTKKLQIYNWRAPGKGVFFTAFEGKSRDGPLSVIKDRTLLLQCDGDACFNRLGEGITRVGCWAHVRRYFHKAKRLVSCRRTLPNDSKDLS